MATNTITFSKGVACPASNHHNLEIRLDASPIGSEMIALTSLRDDPPSGEEVKDALIILMREMVERSGATTKANGRTFLDQATITFDYPAF